MHPTVNVDVPSPFESLYNIAPTNNAVILFQSDDQYTAEVLSFGLVPSWSKPSAAQDDATDARGLHQIQSKQFNCRKELLAESGRVWDHCKHHLRCVIPVKGYFEWLKANGEKIPYYVHRADGPVMYLAGLYAHNHSHKSHFNNDDYFSSFTIITGPASGKGPADLAWLHSRKPLLIEANTPEWFAWLSNESWSEEFLNTALASDQGKAYMHLDSYTVAKDVGSSKVKDSSVIERRKVVPQTSIGMFFKPKSQNSEDLAKDNKAERREASKPKIEVESKFRNEGPRELSDIMLKMRNNISKRESDLHAKRCELDTDLEQLVKKPKTENS